MLQVNWIPIKHAVRKAIRIDSELPLMDGEPVHCAGDGMVGQEKRKGAELGARVSSRRCAVTQELLSHQA